MQIALLFIIKHVQKLIKILIAMFLLQFQLEMQNLLHLY